MPSRTPDQDRRPGRTPAADGPAGPARTVALDGRGLGADGYDALAFISSNALTLAQAAGALDARMADRPPAADVVVAEGLLDGPAAL
ncbi:hypothetical protein [Streptomyces monomycini]|uniref:hypothetical protein n=1 Tax=Streptomyces monomycini TaxID=371720 RepID=UPI0004AB1363|nr:hypothetical protein [Streptomyces monomycini]